MTDQITLEEALQLVEFCQDFQGRWHVYTVKRDCYTVKGNCDIVEGNCITVEGKVFKTINGREWQYIETPRQKFQRLIKEGADKEQLLEVVDQLENNNG